MHEERESALVGGWKPPCYGDEVSRRRFWRGRICGLIAPLVAAAAAPAAQGIAPVGGEFEVTPPAAAVGVPSVCRRSQGGYVVARSEGTAAGGQILARRIDFQGKPVGTDFVVSTYDGQSATDPDV